MVSRLSTFILVLGTAKLINGRQLQPLVCNSVNELPAINYQMEYVYVTSKEKDCTFIFEGPPQSRLDIKVHSLVNEGSVKSTCKSSPIQMYTYNKNKLKHLEKMLCKEADAMRIVADTNTAMITTTLSQGSFFVRVQPLLSPISSRRADNVNWVNTIPTQLKSPIAPLQRSSFLRRSDVDFETGPGVDGMIPPDLQSIDFFTTLNQFEIPLQFRSQPQGFVPSLYYPIPGNSQPTDSYGAPVTSGPILWSPYPGKPGPNVSITSTTPPYEWTTTTNPTTYMTSSSEATVTEFTGYPPSNSTSNKPVDITTVTAAKNTEPDTTISPVTTSTTVEPTTPQEMPTNESSVI